MLNIPHVPLTNPEWIGFRRTDPKHLNNEAISAFSHTIAPFLILFHFSQPLWACCVSISHQSKHDSYVIETSLQGFVYAPLILNCLMETVLLFRYYYYSWNIFLLIHICRIERKTWIFSLSFINLDRLNARRQMLYGAYIFFFVVP